MRYTIDENKTVSMEILLPFNTAHCFIDGLWQPSIRGNVIQLRNPSDGTVLCEIAAGDEKDINAAVNAATTALDRAGKEGSGGARWGSYTALERGRVLSRMGQLVTQNIELLAELEATDVGKPLTQARADVVALARYLEFYAGAADKVHGETLPYLDGYTVYTLREAHGVTGHIIPWNYPMQIIGRSVGAALTMGNACVLKPAEDACLTALMFAEIARQAGLPAGALNVVPGTGEVAGSALASHVGVHHLSFTGSVEVGEKIQSQAAGNVVPVTLELGGKSPQIVFEDAVLDEALPFLVNAGIQNAGQTCSASSRILVQRSIYDDVLNAMAEKYRALRVGPAIADYDLGPLISGMQKQRVESYFAQDKQLQLIASGVIVDEAHTGGNYVAPRLYACNDEHHLLAQQEIFGPVQVVIPFQTEEQAIAIANGTEFGLVASVWTANGARQMRMAKRLRAGQVFINNYGAGGGVELPFGGVGKSGHGREKGFEALYGFSTLKTVAARHG